MKPVAFMRHLFQAHGMRVGSFGIPHMVSVHDRYCVLTASLFQTMISELFTESLRLGPGGRRSL